jgi:hypothetical protein
VKTATLAAAVQQHPLACLRAVEAGLRVEQQRQQQQLLLEGQQPEASYNVIEHLAECLPSSSWFISSMSSLGFWSGAESAAAGQGSSSSSSTGSASAAAAAGSDELVLQLASLLHTCLKITGAKSGKAPVTIPDKPGTASKAEQQHRTVLFSLSVLQRLQEASTQLATQCNSSSNSSSSSSLSLQASSFVAPAFLQLAGVNLQVIKQVLTDLLQFGDDMQLVDASQQQQQQQQQQPNKLHVSNRLLADVLSQCLQHVQWLGVQLQQLLLPGKPDKAAAALQDLQEQQQQLQQELVAAIWRLDQAFESAKSGGQEHARSARAVAAQVGISRTTDLSLNVPLVHALHHTDALWQLTGKEPDAKYDAAAAAQQSHFTHYDCYYMLAADLASGLVSKQLLRQLRQFGSALWAALPQPHCCNNAGCSSLGSISEAKLVARKGSRCSKCQVAR